MRSSASPTWTALTGWHSLSARPGTSLEGLGKRVRPEAEVALVVADAYQHHGLGSLLFERLAEQARDVGIGTFAAATLAENEAMLAVCRDSGYPLRSTVDAGVVDVTLDIGAISSNCLLLRAGLTTQGRCHLGAGSDRERPAELFGSAAQIAKAQPANYRSGIEPDAVVDDFEGHSVVDRDVDQVT